MQRRHKLWLTAAVLLLLLSCLLAGCAGDTGNSDDMVARSDYEAVCAERDQLAAELAQATGDMAVSYTHLLPPATLNSTPRSLDILESIFLDLSSSVSMT